MLTLEVFHSGDAKHWGTMAFSQRRIGTPARSQSVSRGHGRLKYWDPKKTTRRTSTVGPATHPFVTFVLMLIALPHLVFSLLSVQRHLDPLVPSPLPSSRA